MQAQSVPGHIRYADPSPVVDGLGDDWSGDSAIVFLQNNPVASDANEMSVQLAWDEQYLYVLANVKDNYLLQLTDDPERIYLNDALEIYLDPLDDSRNRMDINDYQFILDFMGHVAVLKGDKWQIADSSRTAPKEIGISTVVFQHAVVQAADAKSFTVELALPFAGLGTVPRSGMGLKIDVCVDDVDSLVDLARVGDGGHLPGFFASNWEGYRDFSFPDHWRPFVLVGGPSVTSQISRQLLPYWIWIVAILVVFASVVIGWQAYRIRELKDVLPRTAVSPRLLQQINAAQPPMQPDSAPDDGGIEVVSKTPDAAAAPAHKQLPAAIEKCKQYVIAHIDEDLKIEDLAQEAAMSLRTLQRLFKDEMDMSPVNFVLLLKMERAAELLRGGQCNVSEAAWQLGFADSSYFSRVFKKYHGVSPKTFLTA
jgi:AraC-like DNA-binding protein